MQSKIPPPKKELTQKEKRDLLETLSKKVGISLKDLIGKGGMGEIYNATYGKYPIAVKIIFKKPNHEEKIFLEDCKRESYFTSVSLHENVIKTIGSNKIYDKGNMLYYIAMEKAVNRDLNVLIQSQKNKKFYESFISLKRINDSFCCFFFLQFCKGYLCLYQSKAVHLDIKPENLLLSKDFVVKIADFSLCHYIQNDEKYYKPPKSSTSYMPPESYKKEEMPVNDLYKIDLYAFGVVLFFMKFGKRFTEPSKLEKDINLEKIKESKKEFKTDEGISDECKKFFKETTKLDYQKRINIIDFLQHDWIHKKSEIINYIVKINQGEQRKFCLELQKLDYYIDALKKKTNSFIKKVQNNKSGRYHNKYTLNYKKNIKIFSN